MIDSADQAGLGRWATESQRQADDAAVRAIWRQLHERLCR
jgi:hypothetical protein